jgi:hypothetical protein
MARDWSRADSNGVTRRASQGEVMVGDPGGSLRRTVRVRAEVERWHIGRGTRGRRIRRGPRKLVREKNEIRFSKY